MECRITFGVRYNREPHHLLPGVTGDHYVTVIAEDAAEAREITLRQLGRYWAFDYQPNDDGSWDEAKWAKWCPKGEFARFDKNTPCDHPKVHTVRVRAEVEYARTFLASEMCQLLDIEQWELDSLSNLELNQLLASHRETLEERLSTYLEGFVISTERMPV